MFKKNKQQPKIDDPVVSQVDQDLIVRNMPHHSRFGSFSPSKTESQQGNGGLDNKVGKNNFKLVGGIIIIAGIVFVIGLVYVSYRLIIKPQSTSVDQATSLTPVIVEPVVSETPSTTAEIEATEVEAANSDSAVLTENSSTTEDNLDGENLLPEEGVIPDEYVWTPILDTDGDGLTDEEELLLGTDFNDIDTDKDGYLDLAELQSGYNPNGAAYIKDSLKIKSYENSVGKYLAIYPSAWELRSLNNDYTAIISAADNSLIQISVQENTRKQSIMAWYQETFSNEEVTSDRVIEGDGWQGIMGGSNLNFYLTDGAQKNVYVISYIPVAAGRLPFSNIFEMIIKNFKLN